MPRGLLTDVGARVAAVALALGLAACGSAPPSTDAPVPSGSAAATPGPVGAGLGLLPGVEGFAYREQPLIVPGFVAGANESLAGDAEVEAVQAAVASRDGDEVAVIAFTFPDATDTDAVEYMARILDGMEDAFQAGAQRGLDGEAYVLTFEGQSIVMAPWARREGSDDLIFLFFNGPTRASQELAAAILNAVD
jgi:hypothetical protein